MLLVYVYSMRDDCRHNAGKCLLVTNFSDADVDIDQENDVNKNSDRSMQCRKSQIKTIQQRWLVKQEVVPSLVGRDQRSPFPLRKIELFLE
jgi:hypothetical protein